MLQHIERFSIVTTPKKQLAVIHAIYALEIIFDRNIRLKTVKDNEGSPEEFELI